MTSTQSLMGQLLSAAIHNGKINSVPANTDWYEIYRLAEEHQIQSLLYSVVKNIPCERGAPDVDLLKTWKDITFISAVDEANKYDDTRQVLSAFYEAGIPFIVLKGIMMRELYPKPELRTMCDLDLFIKEDHMDRAREVLSQLEYEEFECTYKHIVYVHEKRLTVELHTKLLDEVFAEKTKAWESRVWDNTITLEIGTLPVRTLTLDDHLMFLCFHMIDHFMLSGFGIRQLYDLAAFINLKRDHIEWADFVIKAKELRISNFIFLVFNICRKLFDIQIPEELVLHSPDNGYIDLAINDIFDGGLFGNHETGHIISGVLNNYIGEKKQVPRKLTRIVYLLFPPYRIVKQKYLYVGKLPVLLPVAWFQRLLVNLFGTKRLFRKNKDYIALFKTHRVYEERFKIIQELRLLEK